MEYRIFKLKEQITSNLKQNWTVQIMAETCSLSKAHFHKLFKKVAKETPIQFLRNARLEESKRLLETTNNRVKEIIHEVGIHDQTHFVRDFKRTYGSQPNEYRQNHWDNIQSEKRNSEES